MKKSLSKNKKGILLMILSSVCACVGQLLWKMSSDYGISLLLVGFIFYGIGALVMLIAYKFGSLSVLHPIISLNYVLSIILASYILNEPITLTRIAGIGIIIVGVIFIGGGDD